MNAAVYPQQGPLDTETETNALLFVIQQMLQKLAGPTLVRVVSCTNDGGLAAQGTVAVQPLVNQMTGNRQAVPHGVLYNLPYQRIQGGANAIIMDPQPGDIGLACFASRDISNVKSTQAQANPGSFRIFDWGDGLYLYSFLGGVPAQYVQFLTGTGGGINIVSPTQITLNAPNTTITGNLAIGGVTTGTGDGIFANVSVSTHDHGGVQEGEDATDPPNPV